MTIDFIFDPDCPNVEAARAHLRQACQRTGLAATWTERDLTRDETPAQFRQFGSPTILVDGSDIAGVPANAAATCCRVYDRTNGTSVGVPPIELIERALRTALTL